MANLENIITEVIKPIEALLGTYGDSGLAAEAMYPALRWHTAAELRAATNTVLSGWTQRGKRPLAVDIAKAVKKNDRGGEFGVAEAKREEERASIAELGRQRRAALEAQYGAERVIEARDFIEKFGMERGWLSLGRTLENWDLIQSKVAMRVWRRDGHGQAD